MRRMVKTLIVAAAVLAATPMQASADDFVNFWIGRQTSNMTTDGREAFGLTAGGMGTGLVGGEIDFGYSPSFFGTQDDFGHNRMMNVMANVLVGAPIGNAHGAGGIRPFVRFGAGLIRTQIDGGNVFNVSSSENHIGWDIGGGIMGFMSQHAGLRGDITYFRNMNGNVVNGLDLGALHFWRLSAGLVLR